MTHEEAYRILTEKRKPIDDHHCPNCGNALNEPHVTHEWCKCCFFPKHCDECGQALDWSDYTT